MNLLDRLIAIQHAVTFVAQATVIAQSDASGSQKAQAAAQLLTTTLPPNQQATIQEISTVYQTLKNLGALVSNRNHNTDASPEPEPAPVPAPAPSSRAVPSTRRGR